MLVLATCPGNSFGGYPTFLAVDSSHGVNQEYRNTPKRNKLKLADRAVIVGRSLLPAAATDRSGIASRSDLDFQFPFFVETSLCIDKALLLFDAIEDSLYLHLAALGLVY